MFKAGAGVVLGVVLGVELVSIFFGCKREYERADRIKPSKTKSAVFQEPGRPKNGMMITKTPSQKIPCTFFELILSIQPLYYNLDCNLKLKH